MARKLAASATPTSDTPSVSLQQDSDPKDSQEYENLQVCCDDCIDDTIQDIYGTFRQTIGDHKLDAHRWEWRPERFEAFAAWLRALADKVEGRND